ncbi:BTB/POZ domain-containing adapter for CUL3-mediated RhoA degradation protein 2 isoform X1 [Homo sapiens]|nr:BTB/POZ domain-containing adapter for CUL3-mediated RhoA degradation protein 2 isoform X1 [Homo sapiens]XP_054173008.1 BTB/POZ domain-containing adapter for CUL3-mediated RhoA degradation protein 2 isoform X1 [Homo sapiens]|eukprot:XP_016880482.1 BTB/POZ domain-containing adapter for CUL3-mediated RhoA degradation protein 2 isoform X1 [Homo sapiens]
MSGDTCLCPASGAKPKLSGFKGGGLGNKYVQLNVGGSLYYTTVRALTRHDTMLKAMFSGRMEVLTDKEGWILIDRCGKHFGTILNYLRDDTITLPQNRQEIKELMAEAKYYLIQGLVNMCQSALQDKKDSYQPVCNIPIITSLKEEERLIESSTKPVVKLLYNRSNNKYSYTSNSDDHLLKNIELFDKLSLRFNGRVLFIKDVIGDEICCWSFYGQGRKLAEVCCTSIVYATEKKQTKVWGIAPAWVGEDTHPLCGGRGRAVTSTEQKGHGLGSFFQTRWNSQRPESMRRHSTSYSMRLPASPTTPCWRPQAVAAARLPPVKMRRPLNCGTVSAASTSSATALTMTGSSATSLPIATDQTLRESGHGRPYLPSCGTRPIGHPMLLLPGSLL